MKPSNLSDGPETCLSNATEEQLMEAMMKHCRASARQNEELRKEGILPPLENGEVVSNLSWLTEEELKHYMSHWTTCYNRSIILRLCEELTKQKEAFKYWVENTTPADAKHYCKAWNDELKKVKLLSERLSECNGVIKILYRNSSPTQIEIVNEVLDKNYDALGVPENKRGKR